MTMTSFVEAMQGPSRRSVALREPVPETTKPSGEQPEGFGYNNEAATTTVPGAAEESSMQDHDNTPLAVRKVTSAYGATPDDWAMLADVAGLTADLLPVVSNPGARISSDSKLKALGKVPSLFNAAGEVVGIARWTDKISTPTNIDRWQQNPDLGICIQTRTVRALDVDIDLPDEVAEIREIIAKHLGNLPVRGRADSAKCLLAFTLPGAFTKVILKAKHGAIEFLADGQQFIAAGTHPKGARYEWEGGMPHDFPEVSVEAFEACMAELKHCFAVEEEAVYSAGAQLKSARRKTDANDGLADYLLATGWVLSESRDGRLNVTCPFEREHSGPSADDTATQYMPAGVGGFERGRFHCLHAHCANRDQGDYMEAVGYIAAQFDALEPFTPDEEEEQAAIEARNQSVFARARQAALDAIEKARIESGGREAFEQARRKYQREENARIGEGEHRIPKAEVVTLQQALNRFVFLADGSRVADMFNPHYDLPFVDWAGTYAASFEAVPQPEKFLPDGSKKPAPDKKVPMSGLWKASPERKTVVCRTFKAGGQMVLPDPAGRLALNLWKPFDRSLEVANIEAAGVGLFVGHVEFLFGKDAGRFLDWLAHIEQCPGELPHTAWLHIAKNFGMGRNWLASVLARVWAGAVAANLDLVGMLGSGFNGRLSRKVLAVVDEIREGGRESQWAHSEKLKSTINEETRTINPKFGRESVEYNSCRWLMFSNHTSAIPLENGDRRIEVVSTNAAPKGVAYYEQLYAALGNPHFIAAVAKFLGARDISQFKPGAHAVLTEAKKAATQASQTPTSMFCEMLIGFWPSDLITSADLYQVLAGDDFTGRGGLTPGHRRVLEDHCIESVGKPVKIRGRATRVSILRDAQKWKQATGDEIRAELQKAEQEEMSAREYLENLAADEEWTAK